jgi:quinol-cytochrome oxidoreductase complex cytochrome b subunit
MPDFSTIILIPFIFAFLIFVLRFYGRESASSMRNPSFIMAFLTMASAGAYLYLRITGALPPYSTAGFGLLGLALLGTAIARMFMI